MKHQKPSETFKFLYKEIIEELFYQICSNGINYSIRYKVEDDEIHIALWKKYEEYRETTLKHMFGTRLDRHKLASCICGAIIEIQPLVGYNNAKIVKKANELLAITVAMNVVKIYMIYHLLCESNLLNKEGKKIFKYLKENFTMEFPSLEKNVCDTQEYQETIANALYWSHHRCEHINTQCFHYDVWAYSKILYHLELYNQDALNKAYQDYIAKQ